MQAVTPKELNVHSPR